MKRHKHILTLSLSLIIGLLYVIFFWRNLYLNRLIPHDGDIPLFFYPNWEIGRLLLSQGFHFLWDPYRNMGQPFLAVPQNQALYPLRFLSLFFSYTAYQQINVFFHTVLAFWGGVFLLRKWTTDKAALCLAGLGFAFNGFFIWRVLYTTDFCSLAWAPLILGCVAWRKPIFFGIAFTLQVFAGFPPFSILTLLAALLFCWVDEQPFNAFKALIKGVLIAAGLSAIMGIPFLEMLSESNRGIFLSQGMAVEKSIAFSQLLKLIFIPSWILPKIPFFHTNMSSFYFGTIIIGLFMAATLTSSRPWRMLATIAIVAFILTLGKDSLIYPYIPGITIMRYPFQFIALASMMVIPLSALFLQKMTNQKWKWGLVLFAAAEFLHYSYQTPFAWSDETFLVPQEHRQAVPRTPHRLFHTMAITDHKQNWDLRAENTWTFMKAILVPSSAASVGQRETFSHSSLTSQRVSIFAGRLNYSKPSSALFEYADIDRVIALTKEGANKSSPIPSDAGLIKIAHPRGRLFFVSGKGTVNNILSDSPGKIVAQVDGPGELIFSESYFPGWQAYVNDQLTAITPFENMFMQMTIPEGPHQIKFIYSPTSFWVGLIISLLTGATLFLIFIFSRISKFSSQNQ